MKRTERRHLKENELERFALQARETMEARRTEVTVAIVVLAVLGAAAVGYFAWHQRMESRAHTLLAEALTIQGARVGPPAAPGTPSPTLSFPTEQERAQAALSRFKAVADAYPKTDAGIYARYQEAATQMTLGNSTAAAVAYQDVMQRAGSGVAGEMAQLGLAEAHRRSGQYDQAISVFMDLSQRKDTPMPTDAMLMELGRTYVAAGKRAEAQQTFKRLVDEYPESPYNGDAKKELDALTKTLG